MAAAFCRRPCWRPLRPTYKHASHAQTDTDLKPAGTRPRLKMNDPIPKHNYIAQFYFFAVDAVEISGFDAASQRSTVRSELGCRQPTATFPDPNHHELHVIPFAFRHPLIGGLPLLTRGIPAPDSVPDSAGVIFRRA